MIATQCPPADQLQALSLGQLSDEQSDELFDHVRHCEACNEALRAAESCEDSLIALLRTPDERGELDAEPECHVAVAKALGSLALAADHPTAGELHSLPGSIGEYEVIRPLGHGGMGSVFLARHTKLGRHVALKILAGHRLADPRARQRFETEMRALGNLHHPNVVTAHDARDVDGTAVLVTEYVDGLDLAQLVRRTGPLAIPDACEIIRQVAVALQYTSEQGFVHRDVKPANIMLNIAGQVKLLDLGLARLQLDDAAQAGATATGQAMGTADYIAPEQVTDSRAVDVRADIYSLGCTLFKLLAGAAPFADAAHATAFAKMTAHVSEAPPSLATARPDAPAALVALIDAMLAKSSQKRPQTPQSVAERLAPFAQGSDLPLLAERAEAMVAAEPSSSGFSWDAGHAAAGTLPLRRRTVPLPMAIGGGLLGLLLGVFLGTIIKIEYPDGTVVRMPLPPGSQVTLEESPAETKTPAGTAPTERTVTPQSSSLAERTESPQSRSIFQQTTPATVPLTFGVLAEEGDFTGGAEAALTESRAVFNSRATRLGRPVSTKAGVWYPLAASASAPIEAIHSGQRWGLRVKHTLQNGIAWSEIQGHVSAISTSSSRDSRVELHFDEQLAQRFRDFSKSNLSRQLAIIVNDRIIAAPKIVSELSDKIVITGDFDPEDIGFLHEALNGLVSDQAERLQGVWRMVQMTVEGKELEPDTMLIALDGSRYTICSANFVTGAGTYTVGRARNAPSPAIDFRDELSRSEPIPPFRGIYRIISDGRLEIRSNQLPPYDLPSSFRDDDTPGLIVYTLENIGPVPHSDREARRLAEGKDAKLAEAILTLGGAVQVPPQELEAPTLETFQNVANQARVRNNLKAIGLAFHNFHDVYDRLPGSSNTLEGSVEPRGYPFSWRVALLPFIEEQELFEQYRFDEPWDSEHNLSLLPKMPAVYRSPYWQDPETPQPAGETHYQGFAGEHTALGDGDAVGFRHITDGTSNTLLVVETAATVPWTKPEDLAFEKPEDARQAVAFDDQPLHFLTVDGAVHAMKPIDWDKLAKMITRDGGEFLQPQR